MGPSVGLRLCAAAILLLLQPEQWYVNAEPEIGTRFARFDAAQNPVDYSRHKLIRLYPRTARHAKSLLELEQNLELDLWSPPLVADGVPQSTILTVIDSDRERLLFPALNRSKIRYEVIAANYQAVIDAERSQMEISARTRANSFGADYDYENSYHTYAQIAAQIGYLADTYPSKATKFSVGKTYEGRDIPALIIGSGSKILIVECGIHSREWVTISFGMWLANYLLTTPSVEPMLENYQFIIVPVLNVDGFVYTHTTNRLWRKTRSPSSASCFGADPNRNWDSAFCQQGASTNPCSETYCGKKAFSEVEALNMANLIAKYKGKIAAYFAVHSYSQLWMYPYGYTTASPANAAKLKALSQAAITAIKSVNELVFTEGTIANTIYKASGSSIDWAYDNQGVHIGFAVELRDKGQYGFQLPANQIKPAVYETWAGVKAVIDNLS